MKFHPFKLNVFEQQIMLQENFIHIKHPNQLKEEKNYVSLLSVEIQNKDIFVGDVFYDRKLSTFFMFTIKKENTNSLGVYTFGFISINDDGYKKYKTVKSINMFCSLKNLKYFGNIYIHKNTISEVNKHASVFFKHFKGKMIDSKFEKYLLEHNFNIALLIHLENKNENILLKGEFNFDDLKEFVKKTYNKSFDIYLLTKKEVLVHISKEDIAKLEKKQSNLYDLNYSMKENFSMFSGELQILNNQYDKKAFNQFLLDEFYMLLNDELSFEEIQAIINMYKAGFYYLSDEGHICFKSTNGDLPKEYKMKQLIHFNEELFYTESNSHAASDIYQNEYLKII